MKKFSFYALTISLASCSVSAPLLTEKSANNQTYNVDYLFEHDGCKVYRFYDRGNYVYFTNCKGEVIAKRDSLEVRNAINIDRGEK